MQSFFGQTGYILEFPLPLSATMVTCYLNEWKHFCWQSILSIRRLVFIFCLLSHFDFFNIFLCWIATEKKKVKILGAQTGIPGSQTAWIRHCPTKLSDFSRLIYYFYNNCPHSLMCAPWWFDYSKCQQRLLPRGNKKIEHTLNKPEALGYIFV